MSAQLVPFGPDIWTCEGPTVPFYAGFPYPTRMAVIRLASGGLFVWSPVALSEPLRAEVNALGPVQEVVSPNLLHHLFLGHWKAAWQGQIDQQPLHGSFAMTEVVFFHLTSRTAIFADLIENLPQDWVSGWRTVAARLDGIVAPHPGAPREWRASFLDRRAARQALERILAWPIERAIIAHGACPAGDAATFVGDAFSWLGGRAPG
ncbi:MAG: hypothetical protein KDK03_11100 [Rhodobacteraceae bacterium]|nr:hypothetical protein [Paracoccaceae bacterium]